MHTTSHREPSGISSSILMLGLWPSLIFRIYEFYCNKKSIVGSFSALETYGFLDIEISVLFPDVPIFLYKTFE